MNFTGAARIEPTAEQREAARGFASIFNAYLEVGFKRSEALELLKFVAEQGTAQAQ